MCFDEALFIIVCVHHLLLGGLHPLGNGTSTLVSGTESLLVLLLLLINAHLQKDCNTNTPFSHCLICLWLLQSPALAYKHLNATFSSAATLNHYTWVTFSRSSSELNYVTMQNCHALYVVNILNKAHQEIHANTDHGCSGGTDVAEISARCSK